VGDQRGVGDQKGGREAAVESSMHDSKRKLPP
jgi:hypothetical protein